MRDVHVAAVTLGDELVVGDADLENTEIPTLEGVPPGLEYPDYDPERTRVVTYAIMRDVRENPALGAPVNMPRAETKEDAVAQCEAEHGRVLARDFLPGRAFLRVSL